MTTTIIELAISFLCGAMFTLALLALHAITDKESYCKCNCSDYEIDKYIP